MLLLTALAGGAWAQDGGHFDGQYVGEMTLTRAISGDCTRPPLGATYPLTIAGGVFRFKYVPRFDTNLTGRVDGNGNFKATAQLHHGIATMTGHTDGLTLTAQIQSPSCEYSYTAKY
ncbi:MAG: hypothetical protein JO258_18950 [Alphaproteobacteria bacterium]|nr:hypothetical protein [Alphaproteobacteria bacterium]